VRDIRRATRRKHCAEDKNRIVLSGLRGEYSIAELCRREGIAQSLYYSWAKEFLEAGKKLLQPAVLALKRPQFAGIRNIHAAEIRLLLIEGVLAAPVTPADLRRHHAAFLLAQDRNDLLFAKS
jgi:transposase-like protein